MTVERLETISMLGEITGIVGKNLVLQAAHLIEQLINFLVYLVE